MPLRTPTPLPLPAGVRSVILVGGSFDPPHTGHTTTAAAARDAADPDAWLVFVPAARSPHKAANPGAPPADRAAMLALAIAALPRAAVWTEELDRPSPSYWVDTLEAARAQLPAGADLRFTIGADQLLALPRWRHWQRILALAEPVVLPREPLTTPEALAAALAAEPAWSGHDTAGWPARLAGVPLDPSSSTSIRADLAAGRDPRGLDPSVLAHIRRRGLYAADPTSRRS